MLLHINIRLEDGYYFGDIKAKVYQRLSKHLLRIRKRQPNFSASSVCINFRHEGSERIFAESDFLVLTHLIAEQVGAHCEKHTEVFCYHASQSMLAIDIEVKNSEVC